MPYSAADQAEGEPRPCSESAPRRCPVNGLPCGDACQPPLERPNPASRMAGPSGAPTLTVRITRRGFWGHGNRLQRRDARAQALAGPAPQASDDALNRGQAYAEQARQDRWNDQPYPASNEDNLRFRLYGDPWHAGQPRHLYRRGATQQSCQDCW